ncbi:MAG: thioredoxin domain-containing protein [Acidobacteria bacterium]|nr:thioredoxin domain-containing protein [Acidobacteriota bacterium]
MSVVRLRRRGGRRAAGLVVACLLAASGAADAQTPRPPLVVQQVVPDRTTDTLTIDGAHFGAEPFVTLDLVPLELRVALDTRIMAAVPVDAMPPGRYLLTVSRGPDATDRASIEVTIGAAAPAAASSAPAPPLARPAPAPAAGDAAAIVGDRTITIGEVDREWQATDPGSYLALMRELYEHRRRIADAMSTSDLLAREAAARSMTTEALLAEEVPKRLIAMPDTALTALYESLGDRTRGAALEKMRPSLRAWLERKTEAELAKMAYIEELVKTSTRREIVLAAPLARVEMSNLDPVLGAPSAVVELVVFGDLQSPDYARLAQVFARVLGTYGARVRLVFKLLPAYGAQSASAAEAGACAHDQGRFWAFHDAAARPATLDARRLRAIPAEAGLDQAAFERCLAAGTHRERPARATAEAARYGIATTPSLLVNGRLAPPPPPFLPAAEYLSRLIEEELQRLARAARTPPG